MSQETTSQPSRETPPATATLVDYLAMARADCYGISFGVDAASELSARRVDKPLDLARARAAMRACDFIDMCCHRVSVGDV